jgi:hypothetical protein
MTTLSLVAWLAIDDNAIIHKLWLSPIDQLLTLLQLPMADLTQVAATLYRTVGFDSNSQANE